MKVIVQAGGLGTRMQAMTASKPKALIDVRNKPILFHLSTLSRMRTSLSSATTDTTFLTAISRPLRRIGAAFS